MTNQSSYASPAAFRRALTDRLRALTVNESWTLPQLQRQVAFDRLLTRLYQTKADWVVKGATALLARRIGVRSTVDIDLLLDRTHTEAEADLRAAAATDIGDWFRFEVGLARPVAAGTAGVRVPVKAYVGATVWTSFHVDLFGSDLTMTASPERVEPLIRLEMEGVRHSEYKAYPMVDHVADKIVATFQRYGDRQAPSTRYKDLVDLVAIVGAATIDAGEQRVALESEARRRGVTLPRAFAVPDRSLWTSGYAKAAHDAHVPEAKTLDDALLLVKQFADPLLDGSAHGRWAPDEREWKSTLTNRRH